MDQSHLLDRNLYKVIERCYINKRRPDINEIFVIYSDGSKESIWGYNPARYAFDYSEFIGKTKIEAIFHCDKKKPKSSELR